MQSRGCSSLLGRRQLPSAAWTRLARGIFELMQTCANPRPVIGCMGGSYLKGVQANHVTQTPQAPTGLAALYLSLQYRVRLEAIEQDTQGATATCPPREQKGKSDKRCNCSADWQVGHQRWASQSPEGVKRGKGAR